VRRFAIVYLFCLATPLVAQQQSAPQMPYHSVPDFFRLPPNIMMGETAAVALDAKGHIFVFTRAPHPLLEFDPEGNFVRAYGEGIFTRPHGLRFDPEGNIWLTDRDAHFVLKMSPDGRVLMVLGRQNQPGVVGNHSEQLFDQPTDVAFGHFGDVFVTDGYGNSRVVKFDKTGKFLKAWGQRGTGPGEFNIPHSIVVDSKGLLYVADRENKRIQIFDSEGNFIKEWKHVGQPWGLSITPGPDQVLYMADGLADRVLKLDLSGNILGTFGERGKQVGQFYFAHGIAVGPNNELYIAEILNWRAQKLVLERIH
jgi:DNA-binding beta-propeller fold protein YncE